MKLRDITAKTDVELNDLIKSEREALAKTIIDSRTKEMKNVKVITAHKKIIARALTIAHERELAKQEQEATQ
jgi:ribosomal protein L29